jgi:L-ribulokinase
VTGRPMRIARCSQATALGAAICGAAAAGPERGGFRTVEEAQAALCGVKPTVYEPSDAARRVYDELYALYRRLHDAFGHTTGGPPVGRVMKDLIELRERVRAGA